MSLLSSYFDDVIDFKIYLRLSPKAMPDREKRREDGKIKIQKIEHLESFFNKIKSIFHNYVSAKK